MKGLALARAGGLLGLGMGVVLAARLAAVQGTGWGLALGIAYLVPFLLAFMALSLRRAGHRGHVCIGGGIAGILLAFSSVAGAAVVLLVPAGLLLVGGLQLIAGEARTPRARLAFVAGPVLAGAATLAVVFVTSAAVAKGLLGGGLVLWTSLAIRLLSAAGRDRATGGRA